MYVLIISTFSSDLQRSTLLSAEQLRMTSSPTSCTAAADEPEGRPRRRGEEPGPEEEDDDEEEEEEECLSRPDLPSVLTLMPPVSLSGSKLRRLLTLSPPPPPPLLLMMAARRVAAMESGTENEFLKCFL